MALLATSRSGKRRRCTSSVFKVAMKLSAIALSKAVPVLPIEGTMPCLRKALAEGDRCVLNAAIRMMHEARGWLTPPHRHLEGIDHELCPHVGVHRPSNDPARMGVQDEGQVEEALPRRYVGDVRQPDPVRLSGHEVPAKQIRCRSSPRITASGSPFAASRATSEPGGSHQPRYSPSTATDPERTELGMHSRISVGLAAPTMDLADLLGEESILSLPLRGRSAAPSVIAALGDPEHRA